MKNIISKIKPDSIAMELGLEAGDKLVSINGTEVHDIIDYKFLITDEEIVVEIEKNHGEHWELEIEKDYDEDLGIEFENSIMDGARSCRNKCIFCFIDQLPKGMRESLYFKDDDSRLSFLQGNFVTLTNMTDADIDRIIRYRISPINISVHTTNPELRKKMLKNRFAGDIFERLKRLAEAGISSKAQIVLVPGVNDGEELKKTIEDLFSLYPNLEGVACVPVGITKYREGLPVLKTFNKESALKEIMLVKELQNKYQKLIGEPFVRLSDEFYVMAEEEVPSKEFYQGFSQLEDGVGMIRILRENINKTLGALDKENKGEFTIITGASGYKELLNCANIIEEYSSNIKLKVLKVINEFFGETITVVGLLTGMDIVNALKKGDSYKKVIIPSNVLRAGERIFLDDMTIEDVERLTDCKIIIADYSGEDLIDCLNKELKEE
ncbi:DUF512 domain-containing protein [Alloiococcus sp. CFN-8]|uniref:DUF512 domain-containing protein n=1 Tax=Alloiococcus sp. CFN-8 TaxID=3416081 RepID=UPI003CFBA6C9